jgi:hypothetical protein
MPRTRTAWPLKRHDYGAVGEVVRRERKIVNDLDAVIKARPSPRRK